MNMEVSPLIEGKNVLKIQIQMTSMPAGWLAVVRVHLRLRTMHTRKNEIRGWGSASDPHVQSRYNFDMSPNAQRLLDEIRKPPPDEREWLAERLLLDNDSLSAAEVGSAWDAEIKRRLDEIDSGKVKMISLDEFVADLDAHIASKRQA
jgi:putative addiction module component (TIGR02574 family)